MSDRVLDHRSAGRSRPRLRFRAVGATVLASITFAGVSVSTASAGDPPARDDGFSVDADGNTVFEPASTVTAAQGQYIVQFEAGADVADVVADVAGDGVEVTATLEGAVDGFTAPLGAGELAELRSRDDVALVEREQVFEATQVQDSPPWGLDRIDQRALPLDAKYSSGYTGAGVDVYVIDSGIRPTHQEFTGRLKDGWYADYGDGTGINDCDGHGTHVAGTVGGTTWGVAKAVKIVPVKVLDCAGEVTTSTLAAGINWVVANHVFGQPAVANISIGGPSSGVVSQAVQSMMSDGITVVVAGGNDPTLSSCDQTPANVDKAITVAASTVTDGRAWFSSPGSCNDLFAPGDEVRSASHQSDTGSVVHSGTSMAAPHVAGAAAQILQRHPAYVPAQVWEAMDIEATLGVIAGVGTDEPDKLLHIAPGLVPAAPTGVSATVAPAGGLGSDQVKLAWTAPASNGGAAVIDYVIKQSTSPYHSFTVMADGVSAEPTFTVSGLTTGTTYYFKVSAKNADGVSSWANSLGVAPAAVPAAPSGLTAEVWPTPGLAAGNLRLRWSVPASNGTTISDYIIESSLDGTTWTTVNDLALPVTAHTLIGLTGGTRYSFRVAAVNAVGRGPWSATVTATPATEPDAPTGLTAAVAPTTGVGSGDVQLTWTAPPDSGAPITDYLIESSLDGTTWSSVVDDVSPATTSTVRGLTGGTAYQFRVSAKNGLGTGPLSSAIQATPISTPAAPGELTASAAPAAGLGSGRVKLAWSAPSSNGAPVSDYVIEWSVDGTTWTAANDGVSTATTATVGGLTNGRNHQFRVAAVNAAGTGSWSAMVAATPLGSPTAPGALTAATAPAHGVGSGEVKLTWSPPADDGGAAITDYLVESSVDGATWTAVDDGVSTATTFTVAGLTNGTQYTFRVLARNLLGDGPSSAPIQETPAWKPAAPGALTAAVAPVAGVGSGQVKLSWSAPADNGGSAITDYLVESSVDGITWTAVDDGVSTATSSMVNALANGTRYQLRVMPQNNVGFGPPSDAVQATPQWTPAAPGALTAAVAPVAGVGSGQVKLSWSAPADNGGSAITDYLVESSVDGITWTAVDDGVSTATSSMVNALANGTRYQLRVMPQNNVGFGPPSDAVQATPQWTPAAPGGLTAAVAPVAGVGSGQVKLSWSAPADNGGAAITDYLIQRSTDGITWTTIGDGPASATTVTVGGLTNGRAYRFRIAAVNAVASGPWSTPATASSRWKPVAPGGLRAVAASRRVRLAWNAPSSNGSAITDYVIQRSTNGRPWTTVRDGVSTVRFYAVTGLTNGTPYRFRVAAKNAVGLGPWSLAVRAVPRAS